MLSHANLLHSFDSSGGGDGVAMLDKLTLPPHEIGAALRDVLLQARDQGRLTCGVYECTQLLQGYVPRTHTAASVVISASPYYMIFKLSCKITDNFFVQ